MLATTEAPGRGMALRRRKSPGFGHRTRDEECQECRPWLPIQTWDAVALKGIELAGSQDQDLLAEIGYDPATAMMTAWKTPIRDDSGPLDSVTHTLTPDGTRGRPASLSVATSQGTVFSSGTYHYDVRGNITGIGPDDYDYDPLSRLRCPRRARPSTTTTSATSITSETSRSGIAR